MLCAVIGAQILAATEYAPVLLSFYLPYINHLNER